MNRRHVFTAALALQLIGGAAYAETTSKPVNVMFVLDASNSMWGQINAKPKIEIAKGVLVDLARSMPKNVQMGLVSYGHRFDRKLKECDDIELMNPIGHFSAKEAANSFSFITPKGQTPIARTLLSMKDWFLQQKGQNNTVVLISDGVESCDGDPCAAAKALNKAGITSKIHVVGFDLAEGQRKHLQCIAKFGGGKYFDAGNADELTVALDEVKKYVAQPVSAKPKMPTPEKLAPAKPAPEWRVHFLDEFDGDELAGHWNVTNPNPDQFIVEGGDLILVGKEIGGFGNKDIDNLISLKTELPKGDWTVSVEFTPDFKTSKDLLSVGLYSSNTNYLAAKLYGQHQFCCDVGNRADAVMLETAKIAGKTKTKFIKPIIRPRASSQGSFVGYVAKAKLNVRTILQLVKRGRSYRTRMHRTNQLDSAGKPVWIETEKVTALRTSKNLMINAAQRKKTDGETLFQIHSVKIEAKQ